MDRLAQLREFLKQDPDDAFTRFAFAKELLSRGDTAEALATFERLRIDHPDYIGTYFHLGKLYVELGRPDDAVRAYREGIRRATGPANLRDRAELQSALLEVQGIGFED